MLYKETTHLGTIGFEKRIIATLVRRIVAELEGAVMVTAPKRRLSRAAQKESSDELSFIHAWMNEDVMDIDLFLILRFGAGIKRTSAAIDRILREEVENTTGISVGRLRIVFTGMISRRFTKRNIEVITFGGQGTA
jgi:uncharacterized alkaline shock family protein YloU